MHRNTMVQNGSEDRSEFHLGVGMNIGFDGWEYGDQGLPEYGDQGLRFN